MNDEERRQLAELLRVARARLDLSAREVARRAGLDEGSIRQLERGRLRHPRPETLHAVARVLNVPMADIQSIVHWLPEPELPSLRPYMRAKYSDLPDSAVAEVERLVSHLSRRYGSGPAPHEDEQ